MLLSLGIILILSRRWLSLLAVVTILCAGMILLYISQQDSLPPEIDRSSYQSAAREFAKKYRRKGDFFDNVSWLAEQSVRDRQPEQAIACFSAIPSSHPKYGHLARFQAGQVYLEVGLVALAEQQFEEFLDLERQSSQSPAEFLIDCRQRLRHILEVELRLEERHVLLKEFVPQGRGDVFDRMAYCFPSLLRWNGPQAVSWLERYWELDPENVTLRIALGRYRTGEGKLAEAERILSRCMLEQPQNLSAIAAMLSCFSEQADWERYKTLIRKVPGRDDSDPWLLTRHRGHWNNRLAAYDEARQDFELALRQDPTSSDSWLGIAKAFEGLGLKEQWRNALHRAQILARIQNRLGWILDHPEPLPLLEVAELALELELQEQSQVTLQTVLALDSRNFRAKKLLKQLLQTLPPSTTRSN